MLIDNEDELKKKKEEARQLRNSFGMVTDNDKRYMAMIILALVIVQAVLVTNTIQKIFQQPKIIVIVND